MAIFSSSGEVAPLEGKVVDTPSGRGAPRTEYVYVQNQGQNAQRGGRTITYTPKKGNQASPGYRAPRFLTNRGVLFATWVIAMILVGWDDWHNNNTLPRPARLWHTSVTYGLLALVSGIDALVPIANAFGIGFTIVLLYQYYQKTGQFGDTSGGSGGSGGSNPLPPGTEKRAPA